MRRVGRIVGVSVASAALAVGVGVSAPSASADVQIASCVKWTDNAGPGGGGRGHAKCDQMNVYVKTTVSCANGDKATSAWRWEYAKAECPTGIKARGVSYKTKK
jgi:hypothetical protein